MSKTDVVLVYPQRAPLHGRHWIMPSLGLMYLSASLRQAGYSVRHIDHTFLERREVLQQIDELKPSVIGIYCMITMQDEALSLAAQVRDKALTVVGGPYPSGEPETFVDDFDLVAVGEGEETIVQIMRHLGDRSFDDIPGLVFRRDGHVVKTEGLHRSKDMSHLPLPYRGDIPNDDYIAYWRKHWKDATTPLMSTRGCPFRCDFCHKSVTCSARGLSNRWWRRCARSRRWAMTTFGCRMTFSRSTTGGRSSWPEPSKTPTCR